MSRGCATEPAGPPAGSSIHIRGDQDPIRSRRTARIGVEKGAPHMTSAQVDEDRRQGGRARKPTAETGGEGYQRGLGSRQVQMIAIGGAIGTGLFLGAGQSIAKAGPSLILAYALAGLVIFFIMRALGELLMYRPVSGSFSEYAREFLGPFFGYVTGWTYWLFWVVTGITEVTAAAIYMTTGARTSRSGCPPWSSLVILFGANLISVKLFGELEFWFSMVKVTAIVGMILICARRPHPRLLRRRRHRRRLQPLERRRLLPQGHRRHA